MRIMKADAMDQYTATAYRLAEVLTKDYSTSFSLSSRLFSPSIRRHIYAIYGLVRVADEIVDTYQGKDARSCLDSLEKEILSLLKETHPFSPNPIVYAFIRTAQTYEIDTTLITPFFHSMRMDLELQRFTKDQYDEYVYGSAEVIGLMCLRVFTENDTEVYESLKSGAQALGSAYQKVNFLRDIEADATERHRWYFPHTSMERFNDTAKQQIEDEIEQEFAAARQVLSAIPRTARKAVATSYAYYYELFSVLRRYSAEEIKQSRRRVPNYRKMSLMVREVLKIR